MNSEQAIIVEHSFSVSIEEVWRAITEHHQMIQWYFENIPDFKAELGFHTEFMIKSGDRTFTHQWKVTEVIPLKKISYQWTYKEYKGLAYSHFELLKEGMGCKLRLRAEGIHTFPNDVPEFTRKSCTGGWMYFIKEQLPNYLSKIHN